MREVSYKTLQNNIIGPRKKVKGYTQKQLRELKKQQKIEKLNKFFDDVIHSRYVPY